MNWFRTFLVAVHLFLGHWALGNKIESGGYRFSLLEILPTVKREILTSDDFYHLYRRFPRENDALERDFYFLKFSGRITGGQASKNLRVEASVVEELTGYETVVRCFVNVNGGSHSVILDGTSAIEPFPSRLNSVRSTWRQTVWRVTSIRVVAQDKDKPSARGPPK